MAKISDQKIRKLWHDPKIGYRGIKTFQIFLKTDLNINISQQRLYKVLKEDPLYLIHLPSKRKFERRSYDISFLGEILQIDLAEMFEFESFKFFLIVTDCFSSRVWTRNLKSKHSNVVAIALKEILLEMPFKIQEIESDRGTEFLGSPVQKLLKDEHIYYAMKFGKNKANFVENKIRIIKRLLYMQLRDTLSQNWPDLLPKVVKSYNATPLEHLGYMRPDDIKSEFDSVKVRDAQKMHNITIYREPSFQDQQKNDKKYKDNPLNLKVGDFVYANEEEKLFDKSFNVKV